MFRKKFQWGLSLFVLTLLIMVSSVAQAAHMELSFQGTIDLVIVNDGGVFTGTQVGDLFSGSFKYGLTDSDAIISPSSDKTDGTDYEYFDAPYRSFITNDHTTPTTASGPYVKGGVGDNVILDNSTAALLSQLTGSTVMPGFFDEWDVHYESKDDPDKQGQLGNLQFGFSALSWNNLNWLTSEAYLPKPPDPNNADILLFHIVEDDVDNNTIFSAWGTIDQHNFTVVPEPISSTLFLVGGATLGFRRFRKKFKK